MTVYQNPFANQITYADYKQLQDEFEMKKQAQAQQAQLQAAQINKLNRAATTGEDLPSAVQEYNFFNKLDPVGQERFLQVKRANPYLNLGGSMVQPTMDGGIKNQFAVTPKPDQMPEFQGNQERAKVTGKLEGEIEGAKSKREAQAPKIIDLVTQAESLLPQATSGGLNSMYKSGAAFFNQSTKESPTDAKLNIIGNMLVGYVPRFEGPQGVLDVQLYKKTAGDLANSYLPIADRLAAAATLKELAARDLNQQSAATQNNDIPQGAPRLGEEQDGYLYIGGDPANPASWRQK